MFPLCSPTLGPHLGFGQARPTHSQVTRADRFWKKVNKDGPIIRPELGPCWVWTAALNTPGYGFFRWRGPEQEHISAHRAAYLLAVGPIPPGYLVCHHCDNKRCVRPDHLFVGDHSANMQDMVAKGRQGNGHLTKPEAWANCYGEAHYKAKLTEQDVRAIRIAYAAGETQRSIAIRYGVDRTNIGCIISRSTWKHVD